MKIAILGSGAMGCLYGGRLAEAGFDVTLVDVWKEHVDGINSDGLRIEGIGGKRIVKGIKAVTDPNRAGQVDLLVVFVKATLTKTAMEGALGLVGDGTRVLTLQNGLGNVETLSDIVGPDRLIAGTTAHGSTLLGPGSIKHAGEGPTVIGNLSGKTDPFLEELAEILEKAGFSVQISENVMGLIWGKLIVNVGINALTAITGLRNGRLLDFPETKELMRMAVEEALEVARRKGIVLNDPDPARHVEEVCRSTAENRSSMLQDVMNRRRTEIDAINGAVVAEAEKLGLSAPVNLVLFNLVKTLQAM
ncbi:2-dehydropantoate 2-reductase [Dethiosulfovibrio sp. F2B]|uniref:ketopantoate reductase family protein n=1 Tax=Dethiosulfovibrio faecalis TaxID=2720018 RepID=UPI001F3008B2|nr:2-dehydropantoate 2-reductase [Dethiosulfovibrio faecalis]MCF4151095.1 2-dehydropantoate 2-reductase [Dethiosulfovibrio faecalis]